MKANAYLLSTVTRLTGWSRTSSWSRLSYWSSFT